MKQLSLTDEVARVSIENVDRIERITRPINHQVEELARVRARRDDGIQRAADHAGDYWRRCARGFLLEYLATHAEPFLAENVREFAEARHLADPPDGRAWGQVMRSAARDGLIVKVGYAPARSSNLSPKVQWRAA